MFNAFDARAKLRAIWQRLRPTRTDVRDITQAITHDTPTLLPPHVTSRAPSHQSMSWETSTRGNVP